MEVEWASADPAHLQVNYNQLEGRFKQLQGKKTRRRRMCVRGQISSISSDTEEVTGHPSSLMFPASNSVVPNLGGETSQWTPQQI